MSPPEPSFSTIAGTKYSHIAETHGKDLKINYIKIVEVHKEVTNKLLKEIQENTQKNGEN